MNGVLHGFEGYHDASGGRKKKGEKGEKRKENKKKENKILIATLRYNPLDAHQGWLA